MWKKAQQRQQPATASGNANIRIFHTNSTFLLLITTLRSAINIFPFPVRYLCAKKTCIVCREFCKKCRESAPFTALYKRRNFQSRVVIIDLISSPRSQYRTSVKDFGIFSSHLYTLFFLLLPTFFFHLLLLPDTLTCYCRGVTIKA